MIPRPTFTTRSPPALPWRKPRFELLVLALAAFAALTPLNGTSSQDVSRVCLARVLLHGSVSADSCLSTRLGLDKSGHGGHLYSDKAPGMSVIEMPTVAIASLGEPSGWPSYSARLWLVRLLSSGIAFLAVVFLVGRVTEGIAPGLGSLSAVTFGLGTLVGPLAAANFEHVMTGALAFGAFLLAWRRRPVAAGLVTGAALLTAYESAIVVALLGIYVALQGGAVLRRYVAGIVPGAVLLGAYDQVAFGAPWHFSYRYIVGENASNQAAGFFGIHLPSTHGTHAVFAGSAGLLVVSPVLIAAAAGLVPLSRRYGREAALCVAVVVAFVLLNCGYFLPYGGISPGPRFLAPALPFLALGLAPALRSRAGLLTVALSAVSVAATVATILTWWMLAPSPNWIWTPLAHLVTAPSEITSNLTSNILVPLGASRTLAAVLVALSGVAAFVVASLSARDALRRPVGDGGEIA